LATGVFREREQFEIKRINMNKAIEKAKLAKDYSDSIKRSLEELICIKRLLKNLKPDSHLPQDELVEISDTLQIGIKLASISELLSSPETETFYIPLKAFVKMLESTQKYLINNIQKDSGMLVTLIS
jgi:hypothetical protein